MQRASQGPKRRERASQNSGKRGGKSLSEQRKRRGKEQKRAERGENSAQRELPGRLIPKRGEKVRNEQNCTES